MLCRIHVTYESFGAIVTIMRYFNVWVRGWGVRGSVRPPDRYCSTCDSRLPGRYSSTCDPRHPDVFVADSRELCAPCDVDAAEGRPKPCTRVQPRRREHVERVADAKRRTRLDQDQGHQVVGPIRPRDSHELVCPRRRTAQRRAAPRLLALGLTWPPQPCRQLALALLWISRHADGAAAACPAARFCLSTASRMTPTGFIFRSYRSRRKARTRISESHRFLLIPAKAP